MNKSFLIILIFIAGSLNAFGQKKTKIDTLEVYQISFTEKPQTIKLVKYSNGEYSGNIKTKLRKGKSYWSSSWFGKAWKNIWDIDSKVITDNLPIDKIIAKNLITELKNNGVETIIDCNQVEECKNYQFLDGNSIGFEIETKEIKRDYYFYEIHPLKDNNLEKIELRKQAQKLVSILYKHIDLDKEFSNTFKRIPKGPYHYSYGAGIVSLSNKRHKKKIK
jgi:hypothetical protein